MELVYAPSSRARLRPVYLALLRSFARSSATSRAIRSETFRTRHMRRNATKPVTSVCSASAISHTTDFSTGALAWLSCIAWRTAASDVASVVILLDQRSETGRGWHSKARDGLSAGLAGPAI